MPHPRRSSRPVVCRAQLIPLVKRITITDLQAVFRLRRLSPRRRTPRLTMRYRRLLLPHSPAGRRLPRLPVHPCRAHHWAQRRVLPAHHRCGQTNTLRRDPRPYRRKGVMAMASEMFDPLRRIIRSLCPICRLKRARGIWMTYRACQKRAIRRIWRTSRQSGAHQRTLWVRTSVHHILFGRYADRSSRVVPARSSEIRRRSREELFGQSVINA